MIDVKFEMKTDLRPVERAVDRVGGEIGKLKPNSTIAQSIRRQERRRQNQLRRKEKQDVQQPQ